MEAAIVTLMLVGAVSLVAAISGGNVKLPGETEFPALRNPILRVTLAVAGVAFVILGVTLFGRAGHESSASPSNTLDTTPPAPASQSRSAHGEFVQTLIPTCQYWRQQFNTLGNLNQNSLEDFARFYGGLGSMVGQWSAEMKRITRPPEEVERLDQIFGKLDVVAAKYADLASAASAGDRNVALQEASRAEDAIASYNQDAQSFGFNVQCLLE